MSAINVALAIVQGGENLAVFNFPILCTIKFPLNYILALDTFLFFPFTYGVFFSCFHRQIFPLFSMFTFYFPTAVDLVVDLFIVLPLACSNFY